MTDEANDRITSLVRTLAENADASDAAVGQLIERLRRMEDGVRLDGADKQTLQRIMSGRRILGDMADFGPIEPSGLAE